MALNVVMVIASTLALDAMVKVIVWMTRMSLDVSISLYANHINMLESR